MAMEIYNGPPPYQEYVKFLETTQLRTREALTEVLQDMAHVKREAKTCKILGEHLFRKYVDAFFGSSFDDESRDEFFRKLEEEEEVIKKRGRKSKKMKNATIAKDAQAKGEHII